MTVSLTHTQTRTVETVASSAVYRVHDEVTSSTSISAKVFVFTVADDLFSRVATVSDLAVLPDTKAQAITDSLDEYRDETMEQDFTSLTTAIDAAAILRSRLQTLVVEFDTAISSFVGTTTDETFTP